ncbi:unnamed protein product [Mucor circinelloides]
MGPPKLKRSTSSSLSRNYRLEPSLSYSSHRRNSTLTNEDIIEDDNEPDPDQEDEQDQESQQDQEHDDRGLSVNSIEREMTLKDRQEAMNKSHPFGLPIWKPALYKKSRSVVRSANRALHSSPSSAPDLFLNPGNIVWLLLFGWWLSLAILMISVVMLLVPFGGRGYARVLRELAFYLLWPFGRYVERQVEITPTQLGNGGGGTSSTSILLESDTEDDEETGLLGKKPKRSNKNIMQSIIDTLRLGPAGCIYYLIFFVFIGKGPLPH